MIRIKEKILQTADSDAHVLVYGKTGTGNGAHRQRHPENQPPQGCPLHPSRTAPPSPAPCWRASSSAPPRAANTGAKDTPGLFELADGGTLFLDEINSMELTGRPSCCGCWRR